MLTLVEEQLMDVNKTHVLVPEFDPDTIALRNILKVLKHKDFIWKSE